MFATRLLAGLALALIPLAPLAAQSVDFIQEDTATHSDVIRLFGEGLQKKTKFVLVQDGEPVKKTKLKTVGEGVAEGEGGGPFVDVQIRKAFEGTFSIGVKQKKDAVGVSMDTIMLVPPTVESVEPGEAEPKDEITVTVTDYGEQGAHKAFIGFKKAKIKSAETDPDTGITTLTVKVPKVANGTWPVSIQNRLGKGTLKNALEITGGKDDLGKFSAKIEFAGMKPFKAKKKKIATDQGDGDPGEVNVGAVSGKKKAPKIFGISLPGQLEDLAAGQVFMLGDDAQIIYSEQGKDGSMCVWSSAVNEEGEDIAVQVVGIDDEAMTLFLCGKLRLAEEISDGDCGPQVLCFNGMITAPSTEMEEVGNGVCAPLTTATGSITGAFESNEVRNEAIYGIAAPNVLLLSSGSAAETGAGTPLQVIEMRVTFNPATDATPATFDSISLTGEGLQGFSLILADATAWAQTFAPQAPPTPSSMSVTITDVVDAGPNPFGILGCIRGTFTGTLTFTGDPDLSQTFSGSFEIPWYDPGFGF